MGSSGPIPEPTLTAARPSVKIFGEGLPSSQLQKATGRFRPNVPSETFEYIYDIF